MTTRAQLIERICAQHNDSSLSTKQFVDDLLDAIDAALAEGK